MERIHQMVSGTWPEVSTHPCLDSCGFVRWCEHRYDYATIVAITKAIARMHLIAGHSDPERHPIVRRTLAMTERSISNRHHRSALFDDDFVSEKPIKKQLSEQIDDKLKKSPPEKRVLRAMRLTPKTGTA